MASDATAWIVQGDPRQWDISGYLSRVSRGTIESETTWGAHAHHRDVEVGNRIFLWASGSGRNAGIVALATVVDPVADRPEEHPGFAMKGFERRFATVIPRLRLRVDALVSPQLTRPTLQGYAGLAGLRVLQGGPQGTLFPVLAEQEAELLALCEPRLRLIAEPPYDAGQDEPAGPQADTDAMQGEPAVPDESTIERINALSPSHVSGDVLTAVANLGGESQRADIIDEALRVGGWTAVERAVVSWYTGAARTYHLRTLADYAVDLNRTRGRLIAGTGGGRWRLADTQPATSLAGDGRPFDPERTGEPWTASPAVHADPAQTLVLSERAAQKHRALLARLHLFLVASGWIDLEETRSIDLRGTDPNGLRHIFEAKTIGDSNQLSQCRGALAQLLEYRVTGGQPDDRLVLAVDQPVSSTRIRVLDALGVAALVADDRGIRGLNEAGAAIGESVQSPRP